MFVFDQVYCFIILATASADISFTLLSFLSGRAENGVISACQALNSHLPSVVMDITVPATSFKAIANVGQDWWESNPYENDNNSFKTIRAIVKCC